MSDFWNEELSPEETAVLIEKAADEIVRRKMEVPATIMLESHKPLSFLGSQASVVFAPFLVPFLGFDFVHNYSRLISKRENVEALLERLESRRDSRSNKEDTWSTQS